jgi:S-adenosylmethionine-diacylglycerol 3-amino-3-carboxypropyl transferase
MHSEFYNVSLDRIRYSLVWEDATTLYHALNIDSSDNLLITTSAGCNVLNALLKSPASVTAVDINPVQSKLLSLKQHIILHHDYATLRGCMGLDGKEAAAGASQLLKTTLPKEDFDYWNSFFYAHPDGLLTSGKLEAYLTGFLSILPNDVQVKFCRLLSFNNVEEQYEYFMKELDNTSFTPAFIGYFDDQNLSKGRAPQLFKYAKESGGEAFYKRLVKQVSDELVADNFYFRFLFFGPNGLPEKILPPCYQKENFDLLKQHVSRLKIVTAEAVAYLFSVEGEKINKCSLSNIFEYTSEKEFASVCSALHEKRKTPLRIVFWNVLNGQGEQKLSVDGINLTEAKGSKGSCFYFRSVRVLDVHPASVQSPQVTINHEA